MFKIFKYENSPVIFKDLFVTNSDVHSHNTRSASQLHLNYTRSKTGKKCISHAGAEYWNELKFEKDCSFVTFKKRLVEHLLENYDRL